MPYGIDSGKRNVLHWEDYVVFGGTLLVSAGVGLYHAIKGRKTSSPRDFHMGNRQMQTIPVALSVSVTFLSALTLVGNPAEVYVHDTMFWWLALSMMLAVAGAAHIFIPVLYKLKAFEGRSAEIAWETGPLDPCPKPSLSYDRRKSMYFELRFGNLIRILASLNWILQTNAIFSVINHHPNQEISSRGKGTNETIYEKHTAYLALESHWSGPVVVSFNSRDYCDTALGGMKTVLWTDSLQSLIIMVGLTSLLVVGSQAVGGFSAAWEVANNHRRLRFLDFNPSPGVRHSFWSVVVGGGIFWMSKFGVNQTEVQRLLSCPSLKKAQIALWLSSIGLVAIVTICNLLGILILAFYKDCNPMDFHGLISRPDQLVPLFAMDIFQNTPCLPGVFLACIFSGSLSSFSSALNALSAVVLEDYIMVYCCPSMSEVRATIISRSLVLLFGTASMAVVYVISNLGDILQVTYTIESILDGPLFGLFVLGMFCPCANTAGAVIGYIVSLSFMLWVGIGTYLNGVSTPKSTTYTHGCNWNISTMNYSVHDPNNISSFNTSTPISEDVSPERSYLSLYELSYLYYTAFGMGFTVVVGVIVSYLTRLCVKGPPVSTKLSRSPLDIITSWIPGKKQERDTKPDPEQEREEGDQTLIDRQSETIC